MATRIFYLTYEGFELIDLAGPSAVFNLANELGEEHFYENIAVSQHGGLITTNTNLALNSIALNQEVPQKSDIILAMGGEVNALQVACESTDLRNWVSDNASVVERLGSVCTGTFVLAASGLLRHKKATTHWRECTLLSNQYPSINVVDDALYVNEGPIWTSAGGTAGVDMALAIIAQDHGPHLAARVAKRLVVYLHRPGYQSQFSDILSAQAAKSGEFSELTAWVSTNIYKQIKVEDMAEQIGMSLRSFHRKFTDAMGLTPSRFIEAMRMERAKQLLENGVPPKMIARKVGYASQSGFQTAFKKHFGIPPGIQSLLHGSSEP